MKKLLLFCQFLILLLSVSITISGQYTGGNPNVAFFKTVITSDTVLGYEPGKAVDNSMVGYCAIPGEAPEWLKIDLGAYHNIDGFGMIITNSDELPGEITFQSSVYGSWWSNLKNIFITTAGTYNFDINDRDSVRYVRIYISKKDVLASFTEVYIYWYEMDPQSPPPMALPATNITHDGFTANWTKRTLASGYKLSVTSDEDFTNYVPGYANLEVGNVLSWDIEGLSPVTTYYYRVKAYNIAGTSNNGNMVSLTTLQSPQTITFENLITYTYGDSDFDLGAIASSGLPVNYTSSDETVATITGSTVTIVGAGITSLTASQEGNSEYLSATPITNDLVVNRKEVTVDGAIAADKVYDGTTDATLSGAILTGVVGADDLSLSGDTAGTFAQVGVGTGIAVSTSIMLVGNDTTNYIILQPTGITADITIKDLTVVADDKSREECASNPEFTISYSGFVGAEDAGALISEPVALCAADEISAAGAFDITISGGTAYNYNLIYVTGTLSITPDITEPELIVQSTTIQLDETGNAMITPADVVANASDNCSLSDTTLSQSTFTSSDVGDIAIDVTVTDLAGNATTESAVVTVEGSTGLVNLEGYLAKIYPNPVLDLLTIETANLGWLSIKITSLNGQIIDSRNFTGNSHQIDLTSFPKGIYFITVESKDFVTIEKIIKLK